MIVNMLKKIVKRILYGNKCDSKTYIKFLKKRGCIIGENTTIYAPQNTVIDITRPYLIEIGDNVEITSGCSILTHGYDWSVLKNMYGNVLGSAGKVTIGNNVFIGVNTTILKGVTIGTNVIVGANSLLTTDIPDNVVCVGNPCRVICSIEDYFQKRIAAQLDEALVVYKNYCIRHNTLYPPIEIFYEFFWLFENELEDNKFKNKKFQYMMELGGSFFESFNAYVEKEKMFSDYDEFIKYCISSIQ